MPPATLPLQLNQRLTALQRAPVEFEMVVDNFAGAGGASMGIEAALGRCVDVSINHNPLAVQIHKANHPGTKHYTEDIFQVDPLQVCAGRSVGLAWFSPDCTHFSRAKGGKPVSKKIRGLAWVVIKWASLVKPRVIILENVAEFQTWGPISKEGQPIKARKGQTFKKWVGQLQALGYQVEWRELVAADFGVPTIRKRLFLIARRDGQPIIWPKATHAKRQKAKALRLKPWVGAYTCIDWSLPTKSIFERKKPLAEATQRRIFKGLVRYVFEAKEPFIVTCNHQGEGFRGQGLDDPMRTICEARDAHGLVEPYMVSVDHSKTTGRAQYHREIEDPLKTVTGSNGQAVVTPYLAGVGGRAGQSPERSPQDPAGTVTSKYDRALVSPVLVGAGGPIGSGRPRNSKDPLNTVLEENHQALVTPNLVQVGYGERKGQKPRALDIKKPLGTVVGGASKQALVAAFINKHYTGVVGQETLDPLGTVTSQDHHSLSAAHLLKFYGTNTGSDMRQPMPSITSQGQHVAEVRAFLVKYFGMGENVNSVEDPAATVTSKARLGLVEVQGQPYQITDIGLRMLVPRELLAAQFGKHARDYVLLGTQAQQIAGIGNSVCPELAQALVKANVEIQMVTKLGRAA